MRPALIERGPDDGRRHRRVPRLPRRPDFWFVANNVVAAWGRRPDRASATSSVRAIASRTARQAVTRRVVGPLDQRRARSGLHVGDRVGQRARRLAGPTARRGRRDRRGRAPDAVRPGCGCSTRGAVTRPTPRRPRRSTPTPSPRRRRCSAGSWPPRSTCSPSSSASGCTRNRQAAVSSLGFRTMDNHAPARPGDELSACSTVLTARLSRPGVGIVTMRSELINRRDELVFCFETRRCTSAGPT